MLAAAANGYQATVTLLPAKLGPIPTDPQPELLARIDLAAGKPEPSELYDAIPRRHTNRGKYIPEKPMPVDFIDTLNRLPSDEPEVRLFLLTKEADRRELVEITAAANDEIYADPAVNRGSDPWIRTKWSDVQKFRDGLTVDAFGQPPIATAIAKTMPLWMLRRVLSRGEKDGYAKLMLTAPAHGHHRRA